MRQKDPYNRVRSAGGERDRSKGFKAKALQEEKKGRVDRRWLWLLLAVLFITALSYANSLQNQYVFDDLHLISSSPQVTDVEKVPELLLSDNGPAYYRPVRTISYNIDYTLNKKLWYRFADYRGPDRGLNPFGYHVSNIFYHIVTAVLVYMVICRLLGNTCIAFICASLFALHPVHTDSVTYLSGRRDILFTLFYLAGFYCFLCYRQEKKALYIVAALLMYLLSMGAKEMGVTLPGLFLAYDLVTNFNPAANGMHVAYYTSLVLSAKKSFRQSYVLYTLTFLGAGAYSYYKAFLASTSLQTTYYGDSALTTFLTVGKILVHYIYLLVYPIRLNADYSYNAFPLSTSFFEPATCLSIVLLLLLVYVTIRLAARHPMAAFGIAWFFITLLPVCHIIPHHELLAEHYLYLPSVGFFLAAGLLGSSLNTEGKHTMLAWGCFLAVLVLFALRTTDRNRDWKDNLSLYEKTVKTAPQCARAHSNLGEAYASRGRIDEAITACRQALSIKPRYAEAHYNLGYAYFKKGRLDDAIGEYREAVSIEPRYPKALNNLGAAYLDRGDNSKAIFYFMKAMRFKSVQPEVLIGLGVAFSNIGMLDKAIARAQRALMLKPSLAVAHNNLAYLYYLKHDYALAVAHCDKAIRGGYPVPQRLIKWLEPYRGK